MSSGQPITATMLYDLVQCPHRVTMDLFVDPAVRDPANPFVELLWARGNRYEAEIMSGLQIPYTDLSHFRSDEKARRTREAMDRGDSLIYSGRIAADDLLGDPDLLRKEAGGYVPGDIKSGAGDEGLEEHRTLKPHYAVQLAVYVDILERMGRLAGRRGFIWDVHGAEVPYDFTAPKARTTATTRWDDYQVWLGHARAIVAHAGGTLPASSGTCKLCHWYTACADQLQADDDLTLIPELGRGTRDVLRTQIQTIAALAAADPETFIQGNTTVFRGIGPERLRRFHARARLLSEQGLPYLREAVALPRVEKELFFDIEHDPMRDVCYLHGFIERTAGDNATERYVACFAERPTPAAERQAFTEAIAYLRASRPCAVYYYSKYEWTTYRALQAKYPDVVAASEIEEIFDPSIAIDLYSDVVLRATEWPTSDYSIKTLAQYLGFMWRDPHPSGTASIEWFNRWVQTGDPAVRQHILEYNEDDCRATRVLLDGIRSLNMNT